MSEAAIWNVELQVDGPVCVRRPLTTTQQKGFRVDEPFYSDIEIQSSSFGFHATVSARARDEHVAYKAAVYFFGNMLNALTLEINRPLFLGFPGQQARQAKSHQVRRIIQEHEFDGAFREAHVLARSEPIFMRSLGWYRKGLTSDDPLDRFLAYWNAIEIVASHYYKSFPDVDLKRSKLSKGQVWESFKGLWGDIKNWPIIPENKKWIDESYDVRLGVAHGVSFVDIHRLTMVADRLPVIEQVCWRFLQSFRNYLATKSLS